MQEQYLVFFRTHYLESRVMIVNANDVVEVEKIIKGDKRIEHPYKIVRLNNYKIEDTTILITLNTTDTIPIKKKENE